MASYRGRTGPNFSQYLSELNTVSPTDQTFLADEGDFSNDLAMYTNTDFTNLDLPGLGEDAAFGFDLPSETPGPDGLKYEDLLASNDFVPPLDSDSPTQAQPFYSAYTTPIQPAPTTGFPAVEQPQQTVASRNNGRPRADTAQSNAAACEEKSRLAAEEDKRRRNTAASARFRVKKKQREQALEKTLKEATDKSSKLEARLSQLETENKWLKGLILEKNGLQSKEDMAAAYEKHRKESEERDVKQAPAHAHGVGTD